MSESNCLSNNISEPSGKIMEVVTSCYIPQRMHFKVLPKNGIGWGKTVFHTRRVAVINSPYLSQPQVRGNEMDYTNYIIGILMC